MSAFSDSHLTTQGAVVQLSYELPHRIHTAATYPVRAPNGSTIILYGHSYGIKIIWRGGRPSRRDDDAAQVNGSAKANGKSASVNSNADYGSDEEDTEPTGHFPLILHDEDLCLGTGVLHISVPDFRCISGATVQATSPPIFRQKIVCAVACEDYTIRTFAIPLEPPSSSSFSSSEASTWGEEIAVMGGVHGHQAIPNAISMTWTLRNSEDDSNGARYGRYGVKSGGFPVIDMEREECDLLIASHSAQVSGVILLARVAIERVNDKTSTLDTSPVFPFQTVYLRGPARQIGFNPMPHPSPRHSHLLVAEIQGPTRVFDPFSSRYSSSSSAVAVAVAATASSQEARNSSKTFNHGSWLATFFPSYDIAQVLDDTASKRNRYILDAQWTCSGREIVGLFADGEWGVWDVDALMNGSSNALQQQQQQQRSKPTIPTHFAIRGYVGLDTPSSSSSSSSSMTTVENPSSNSSNLSSRPTNDEYSRAFPSSSSTSLLAPMTPNTRREKGGRVFSSLGGAESSNNDNNNNNFRSTPSHSNSTSPPTSTSMIPHGGSISISRIYDSSNGRGTSGNNTIISSSSSSSSKTKNNGESSNIRNVDSAVLIHYAGQLYSIPSLRAFRKRCVMNDYGRIKMDNNKNSGRIRGSAGTGIGTGTGTGTGSLYGPGLARLQGVSGGGQQQQQQQQQQQITTAQYLSFPTVESSLSSSSSQSATVGARGGRGGGNHELLITAEYKLIFYSDPALLVRGAGGDAGGDAGSLYGSSGNSSSNSNGRRNVNTTSASTSTRRRMDAGIGNDIGRLNMDMDMDIDNDTEMNMDVMDIDKNKNKNKNKNIDQQLLSRGQLDLNGVSRLLDNMTDNHDSGAAAGAGTMVNGQMQSSSSSSSSYLNKRVGFAA